MLQFYESRCGKYSLEIKLFLWNRVRLDTIQKGHLSHKQYEILYRKIKCDLLNFRGVQYGYHQDFQYLMVSIHSFMK